MWPPRLAAFEAAPLTCTHCYRCRIAVCILGPDDPASIAWLRTHWGVVRALRHVRLKTGGEDRRLRRSARVAYEFWSADWTPWAAFQARAPAAGPIWSSTSGRITAVSDGLTDGEEREGEVAEGSGDLIWDDWENPPWVPEMPVLHLDGFDGPMDLLLDLAERQRIDFGRMSIRDLAEQFVAAMERLAGRVSLERRADWLVLATRLVLLRSRLLFPASPEAAIEAEQEAGIEVRRLEEMVFVRAAASWLMARPQLGTDVFGRLAATAPSREGGYVALMEACLFVLRGRGGRPEEALVYRQMVPDLWRVSDALARIRLTLADYPEGGDLRRFLPHIAADAADRALKARAAVASTLLAGLELAREGDLAIDQEGDFGLVRLIAGQQKEELAGS